MERSKWASYVFNQRLEIVIIMSTHFRKCVKLQNCVVTFLTLFCKL